MNNSTDSFSVGEARRTIRGVSLAVCRLGIRRGDIVAIQNGAVKLSALVAAVQQADKNEVLLRPWQRQHLEVAPSDQVVVSCFPQCDCPDAEEIALAVGSDLLLLPNVEEVAQVIRQAMIGQPVIGGELRRIPFPLDERNPETTIQVLTLIPDGSMPCMVSRETRLQLQGYPLAELLKQAHKRAMSLLTQPSTANSEALLDVLSELGRSADALSSENENLRAQIERLTAPALEHAVVVGPSEVEDAAEDEFVIGAGSGRLTVKLANASRTAPERVCEGAEVLLNKERNIVDVCGEEGRGEAVEVVNVLAGNRDGQATRLQVRMGGGDLIVDCGQRLQQGGVEIGDLVRVDSRARVAFEKLQRHETGELELEEVPDVTYDHIGGLAWEIELIRDAIELPYLHLDLYRRFNLDRPKGILLYGPPGCGKTMIAKAMANGLTHRIREYLERKVAAIETMLNCFPPKKGKKKAKTAKPDDPKVAQLIERCLRAERAEIARQVKDYLDGNAAERASCQAYLERQHQRTKEILTHSGVKSYFLNIKGPELLTKWVGETELKIRKVFEMAKKRATFATPVVLFFDEMEALFRKRGSGISSDVELTIVPMFLSEMDGVEEYKNVIVVGATNRHDLLDPAIKREGRLDEKIFIGRPSPDQARQIFEKYFFPWQHRGSDRSLPLDLGEVKHYGSEKALVEAMADKGIQLTYNDRNLLRVTTRKGSETVYPLREFVSGALIRAMVARASQYAVKQEIESGKPAAITLDLFGKAVRDEFAENKDHLIDSLPELGEEGFDIELHLSDETAYDKWEEPKRRPYLLVEPVM